MELGPRSRGFSGAACAAAAGSRSRAATNYGWGTTFLCTKFWAVSMSELIPSKTKEEIEDGQDKYGEERREEEIKGDKPPHHD